MERRPPSQAKEMLLSNNNLFRSTSFRPKKGVDMTDEGRKGRGQLQGAFGDEVKELTHRPSIATAIREAVERHEDDLQKSLGLISDRTASLAPRFWRTRATRSRAMARRGGERDHDLQRLAPVNPGRDQAGDGPFRRGALS